MASIDGTSETFEAHHVLLYKWIVSANDCVWSEKLNERTNCAVGHSTDFSRIPNIGLSKWSGLAYCRMGSSQTSISCTSIHGPIIFTPHIYSSNLWKKRFSLSLPTVWYWFANQSENANIIALRRFLLFTVRYWLPARHQQHIEYLSSFDWQRLVGCACCVCVCVCRELTSWFPLEMLIQHSRQRLFCIVSIHSHNCTHTALRIHSFDINVN